MEGTWDVRMTLRDCQTGSPVRTFRALSTFERGGVLIEVEADEAPGRLSAGQGTWRHVGERSYSAVLRFFRFRPDGAFAETQRVSRLIELSEDGREFTATASLEVYGPDDSLLQRRGATEMARLLD